MKNGSVKVECQKAACLKKVLNWAAAAGGGRRVWRIHPAAQVCCKTTNMFSSNLSVLLGLDRPPFLSWFTSTEVSPRDNTILCFFFWSIWKAKKNKKGITQIIQPQKKRKIYFMLSEERMKGSFFFLIFLTLLVAYVQFQADAAIPAGTTFLTSSSPPFAPFP